VHFRQESGVVPPPEGTGEIAMAMLSGCDSLPRLARPYTLHPTRLRGKRGWLDPTPHPLPREDNTRKPNPQPPLPNF